MKVRQESYIGRMRAREKGSEIDERWNNLRIIYGAVKQGSRERES